MDRDKLELNCSLLVNGSAYGSVQVPYTLGSIFFPDLPLAFGKIEGGANSLELDSFVGCIQGLAIDGSSKGFGCVFVMLFLKLFFLLCRLTILLCVVSDVKTDVECFETTRSGLGFSGLSRISK